MTDVKVGDKVTRPDNGRVMVLVEHGDGRGVVLVEHGGGRGVGGIEFARYKYEDEGPDATDGHRMYADRWKYWAGLTDTAPVGKKHRPGTKAGRR